LSVQASLRPRGPYSLTLTARAASDATRVFRDGVLDAVVPGAAGPERVRAWQRPDGTVDVVAASAEGVDRVRFVLALDDDHSEFLRRFRKDRLLREATWHLRGLRVVRTPTVALALLRALCGQLIESSRARELERRIVRATAPRVDGLCAPPTGAAFLRFSPAELRRLGLHARRGAALVRLCGTLELERLHGVPTPVAAARLERERGLGPWSVGVVCLEGLGRPEVGLVGDLGLIKLCSALRGQWVEAAETAELLEPYGEWAGLASVYLMAAFARGLVPLRDRSRVRKPPARIHRRAA
jgi:AraC family transcriptional regulator of adaptative response / DNA-3-methyladenine glycosylase II